MRNLKAVFLFLSFSFVNIFTSEVENPASGSVVQDLNAKQYFLDKFVECLPQKFKIQKYFYVMQFLNGEYSIDEAIKNIKDFIETSKQESYYTSVNVEEALEKIKNFFSKDFIGKCANRAELEDWVRELNAFYVRELEDELEFLKTIKELSDDPIVQLLKAKKLTNQIIEEEFPKLENNKDDLSEKRICILFVAKELNDLYLFSSSRCEKFVNGLIENLLYI